MDSSSEREALLSAVAYGGAMGGGLNDSENGVPVLESVMDAGSAGGSRAVLRGRGGGIDGGAGMHAPSSKMTRGAVVFALMGVALVFGLLLGVFEERANLFPADERLSLTSATSVTRLPEPVEPIAVPDSVSSSSSSASSSSSRPYIHVGFQAAGDFGWLALVKLLEVALPGVDIRFSDPDLRRSFGMDRVPPNDGVVNLAVTELGTHDADVPIDLVVEGPSIYLDGYACWFKDQPWIQVIEEPASVYNNFGHCEHPNPPLIRLDTSSAWARAGDGGAYDRNETTYVWSPYAMEWTWFYHDRLAKRAETSWGTAKPWERPRMAGWVSGHCQGFRSQMFRALRRAAKEAGVEGVDSLGNCEHSRDFSNDTAWPPAGMDAWDIYPEYRWVLALENSAELGYVTEKLPNALAAGAVAIYYGDSVAARKIFKEQSYVDILRVWRETLPGHAPDSAPESDDDWLQVARFIVAVDADPDEYRKYALSDVLQSYPETVGAPEAEGYPNEPWPLVGRDIREQATSPTIAEAVRRLKDTLGPLVRRD